MAIPCPRLSLSVLCLLKKGELGPSLVMSVPSGTTALLTIYSIHSCLLPTQQIPMIYLQDLMMFYRLSPGLMKIEAPSIPEQHFAA